MDNAQSYAAAHPTEAPTRAKALAAGGSFLEASGGIATIALAIVGLARIFPVKMAAIAAIVVGAAALTEGGAFASKNVQAGPGETTGQLGESALGLDFLGGLATIVLGILALLGIAPPTLLSVALIVLGATFLFSGRVVIGLGTAVLGILAVVGLATTTLVLVGLLVLGAGLLFAGSEIAASTLAVQT